MQVLLYDGTYTSRNPFDGFGWLRTAWMRNIMTRKEIYFSGSVQGVGFRFTSKQVSRRYEVTGTVENLTDGRVKMICEGDLTQIEAFIVEVSQTTHGRVSDTEILDRSFTGEFEGFEIVR